jgi:hypothetical protein
LSLQHESRSTEHHFPVGVLILRRTMMQVDRLRGKAVYFVRNCPKAVGEKSVEQDLLVSHTGDAWIIEVKQPANLLAMHRLW